jgi:hypothetical protein
MYVEINYEYFLNGACEGLLLVNSAIKKARAVEIRISG